MWNDSKTISHNYPPWNSIPSHAWGHLRSAHLLSQYREQHSGTFSASGKASCLCCKMSKTAISIYETSMQIPCNILFKYTFLSDSKYRKFFSALYMFSWPWLHSTKERILLKVQKTHTTILDIPVPLLQLNIGQRNKSTGTNLGVRESRWEQWPLKANTATSSKNFLQGTSGKK